MRGRKRKNNTSNNHQIDSDQAEIFQTPNSHLPIKNKNKQSSHYSSQEQDQIGPQLDDEEEGVNKRQNTLTILTKRFTKLIKSKQNFILDINQATRELGVQKRRIYDITNVLQGIGYIQKMHKNKMKWIGGTMDLQVAKQVLQLDQQIDQLIEKNRQIDQEMIQLTYKLKKQTQNKKELNYFLEQDLTQILQNAPNHPNSMFVIKAVEGSVMQFQGNKLIIQKEGGSEGEMMYSTLTKKDKEDCFSIIK